MQILDKDIRVNFTSIENQALRNGLDVVTRLASNISGDADTTSEIGVNAVSARDAINYLLNQGGSDSSLEVMSPYEGLIVTQEQMATLEAAKQILSTLMSASTDDQNHDWRYLDLDLELPINIGTEESPTMVNYEPDSFRIYSDKGQSLTTPPYKMTFSFTGSTNKVLYRVSQPIAYVTNDNPATSASTYYWTLGEYTPTYEYYDEQQWHTISSGSTAYQTMVSNWPGGSSPSFANSISTYFTIIVNSGFNPNGAYNWISERTNITDAAQELYDLYSNVLNNYTVSDVEQFPTYDLGTWTWINMPFDRIPIVFNNDSHTFTYYFKRNDQTNTGTLTDENNPLASISLPKEEVDSVELQYHVSLGEGTNLNNDQVAYKMDSDGDGDLDGDATALSALSIKQSDAGKAVQLESAVYTEITLKVKGTNTGSLIYQNSETGTRLEIVKSSVSDLTFKKVVPIEALSYTLISFNGIYPVNNTSITFPFVNNKGYYLEITPAATTTGNEATLTINLSNRLLSGSYLINNIEYWITPSNLERSTSVTCRPITVPGATEDDPPVTINEEDITVEAGPGFIFVVGQTRQTTIKITSNMTAILDSESENFS